MHALVKPRKVQVGLRERILCTRCETIVSAYERRFKGYWYGPLGLPRLISSTMVTLDCPDIEGFRLFHLSVLLRASFATMFFGAVSLGSYYEGALRACVLRGKAPPPTHFPIVGNVLVDDAGCVMHHLIVGATRSVLPETRMRVYCMTYAGCEWYFFVTDHPTREQALIAGAISSSGRITLVVSHQAKSLTGRTLIAQLRRAKEAGRLRRGGF
jgi:hypothetical protein